jgi:serine/threonine protein kinase/pimeloyl-ACP methyl ester carboxylesterase/tetratricopeptide (TPR) repeat protein
MKNAKQQIRFCTSSDGVSLAYAITGSGPPLVKAANWLNHLEYDWNSPVWNHWITELSRHHTLVRYDERGCGLSDWNVEEFSLEAWVRDLEAVVEASKLERFPLLGLSQGGPIAITYAFRHPEKVSHLILYGSYAVGLKQRNLPKKALEEAEMFSQLIRVGWGKDHAAFRQVFTSLFMPEATAEEAGWFNELQRVSCSPENAARMLDGFFNLNVTELATQLNVPTLVIHAHGDLRIPFDEGRRLAALIPNSHFVPLYSRNHILLRTEPAWQRFLSEVRSFLGVAPLDQHATLLMPPERTQSHQMGTEFSWKEISALFERAAGLGPIERDMFLNRVEDPNVRRQVQTLLENDDARSVAPELTEIVKGSILSFQRVDDLVGRTISHYRVLEKLGEGGMGTVYKARDDRLDRFVALKFLPTYLSAKKELKDRFIQEAKAAAALDHANICTVYEIGEAPDGQLFISMACYEGETLREKIDRGPLPLGLALSYAEQAAQGLAQAHAAGIVHRDIKPANLFITNRGQAKILDFGIAKVADVHLTNAGALVGTVAYMSPEQGDGRATDYRTDVWSLGVVLYEMLTGKHPFAGKSGEVSLYAIQHEEPPRVSSLRPEAPASLDAIVKRLLAKLPEERYSGLDELIADLEAIERSITLNFVKESTQATATSTSRIHHESRASKGIEYVSGAQTGAFVGRQQEMRRLESLLQRAAAGMGQIVFITGEAGLGKTSLASEFLKQTNQSQNSVLCLSGHCVEQYGASEAYLPFLTAFGALLTGPAKESVRSALLTYAPAWSVQFTSAFTATDVREQLRLETLGATQERMLREMGDCLAALADQAPVILLLEDLHWGDPPSINLVRYLSKIIASKRILLIGTFRSEDLELINPALRDCRRELQASDQFEEMILGMLGRNAIADHLNARFSPNNFSQELAELIKQKTDGHPLFIARLAKDLAERGDIIKVNSHWELARKLSEVSLEMPESVLGMIRRRIEVLGDEDARLLRYASVQGEEFLSLVTAELLDIDPLDIEERLDRLATLSHLVRNCGEEELPDRLMSSRYRFAHSLYQNVLYQDLVGERRRQLHRLSGEVLEKHYGESASQIAAQLAMHFERARDFSRSIRYLIQVGDNSAKVHAPAEAVEHYSNAIKLVDKLEPFEQAKSSLPIYLKRGTARMTCGKFSEAMSDFEFAIGLARDTRNLQMEHAALNGLIITLFVTHRMDEMARRAEEALQLSERSGNTGLRLETLAYMAQQNTCHGNLDIAIKLNEQVIAEANAKEDQSALVMALLQRGQLHLHHTEYSQAVTLLKRGLEGALRLGDGFKYQYGLFMLGMAQGNLGQITAALATFNEMKAISERNGDRFWLVRYPNCAGWLYRELEDINRAVAQDKLGAELTSKSELHEVLAHSLINLSYDYVQRGSPEESRSVLAQAEDARDRDLWMQWRHNIRLQAGQAELWLVRRDLDRAEKYTSNLCEAATRYNCRKYTATAHKLFGEIASLRGQQEEAEKQFETALTLLEQYPASLVAWKTYAALGRLRIKQGRDEAAREAFSQAAKIINEIAANVDDEDLRHNFLTSEPVREVLNRCFRINIGEKTQLRS